ncbi:carbohydrate ABC transporter membrane protein 2, CUT1 family [Arthrobacter sp. FB24]|uniref:carbohydrate ABC transporter permease n=1 Tax=Arthrobacter sp. (strain FB24) TaxID=290399 RepID=UPI0000527262|nr:carbohydrate ABC transporter permease [Arthrobacter sp. FB24]ABK03755.1 carbohydrate ABC transporter membrane protein 2, CUT1 family [Arthrobacter sp. FB24]
MRTTGRPPLAVASRRATRRGVASPGFRRARTPADAALLLIGACFVLPLLWLVFASLDTTAGYQTQLPASASLDNFAAVLTPDLLLGPLWNSLLLSAGTATVTLAAAVLAAYPLSRFQSRFNRPFMYSILCGTCLPITAIMVPVYGLFVQLRLLDSLPATVLFLAATSLPMAIWMTKNFMDAVPVSLEEAAWVDGASGLTALRSVVLPLMRQGLGVVFIFVFIQTWGNFFVPFILLLSPSKQPASVSIFSFFGQHGAVAYGQLAAFSILYSVPVLVLYVLVARGAGGSFALSGAMKG